MKFHQSSRHFGALSCAPFHLCDFYFLVQKAPSFHLLSIILQEGVVKIHLLMVVIFLRGDFRCIQFATEIEVDFYFFLLLKVDEFDAFLCLKSD